jgi:hypothetical protein
MMSAPTEFELSKFSGHRGTEQAKGNKNFVPVFLFMVLFTGIDGISPVQLFKQ